MLRNRKGFVLFVALGAAIGAFWRSLGADGRRGARRQFRRDVGFLRGRVHRLGYRLSGAHPDADVPDTVLADRIRSTLGPLEKRLDIPRVHVMACDHNVLLHGCVGSDADAAAIEEAVLRVPGVISVTSELHIGLGPGDERPSMGRRRAVQPSAGYRAVVDAAAAAGGASPGAEPSWAPTAAGAVLSTLCAGMPPDERDHLLLHLPADVRGLVVPSSHRRFHRADDFVAAAKAADAMPDGREAGIVCAVLAVIRDLVPEEAHDVSAVLPAEVAELWWSSSRT